MQKPNYEFVKRQKEMKKKRKNEEKLLRKLNKANEPVDPEHDPMIETVLTNK
jgi:hypothetical protein